MEERKGEEKGTVRSRMGGRGNRGGGDCKGSGKVTTLRSSHSECSKWGSLPCGVESSLMRDAGKGSCTSQKGRLS